MADIDNIPDTKVEDPTSGSAPNLGVAPGLVGTEKSDVPTMIDASTDQAGLPVDPLGNVAPLVPLANDATNLDTTNVQEGVVAAVPGVQDDGSLLVAPDDHATVKENAAFIQEVFSKGANNTKSNFDAVNKAFTQLVSLLSLDDVNSGTVQAVAPAVVGDVAGVAADAPTVGTVAKDLPVA